MDEPRRRLWFAVGVCAALVAGLKVTGSTGAVGQFALSMPFIVLLGGSLRRPSVLPWLLAPPILAAGVWLWVFAKDQVPYLDPLTAFGTMMQWEASVSRTLGMLTLTCGASLVVLGTGRRSAPYLAAGGLELLTWLLMRHPAPSEAPLLVAGSSWVFGALVLLAWDRHLATFLLFLAFAGVAAPRLLLAFDPPSPTSVDLPQAREVTLPAYLQEKWIVEGPVPCKDPCDGLWAVAPLVPSWPDQLRSTRLLLQPGSAATDDLEAIAVLSAWFLDFRLVIRGRLERRAFTVFGRWLERPTVTFLLDDPSRSARRGAPRWLVGRRGDGFVHAERTGGPLTPALPDTAEGCVLVPDPALTYQELFDLGQVLRRRCGGEPGIGFPREDRPLERAFARDARIPLDGPT